MDVFISYAHKDEALKEELEKQLAIFKRNKLIKIWNDRNITAGSEWAGQIDQHLEKANLILLLISSDFLASDYSYDHEMKRALSRHHDENDDAIVVPVILRDCLWKDAPFGKLQSLPRDGKAITNTEHWNTIDEGFFNVASGLSLLIKKQSTSNSPTKKINIHNLPPADTGVEIVERHKYNCDRDDNIGEFHDHELEHEGFNFYTYFVCGREEQHVKSFVTRITHEILSKLPDERLFPIKLREPSTGDSFKFGKSLANSQRRFRSIIKYSLGIQNEFEIVEQFSFSHLIECGVFGEASCVFLDFEIASRDWLKHDYGNEFVKWLVTDFFKQPTDKGGLRVVLVLNMIFDHTESTYLSRTFSKVFGNRYGKSLRIKKQLSQSGNFVDDHQVHVYCNLDELTDVGHEELRAWYRKFYSNSGTVTTLIKDHFDGEEKNRPMAEVETVTHQIIDYFLQRQNPLQNE